MIHCVYRLKQKKNQNLKDSLKRGILPIRPRWKTLSSGSINRYPADKMYSNIFDTFDALDSDLSAE